MPRIVLIEFTWSLSCNFDFGDQDDQFNEKSSWLQSVEDNNNVLVSDLLLFENLILNVPTRDMGKTKFPSPDVVHVVVQY